jgi:hypothetical protein
MTKSTDTPPVASVEADLFGALFGFHTKITTLLRQSSLADEKLNIVANRIKILLDAVTEEVQQPQQVNMRERLEAAYCEVKRLVDQLSGISDGGKKG